MQRHVSLALDDINYAGKLQPDVPLKTGVGSALTVADYEKQLRSRLDQYPGRKPLKVSRAGLAAAVLDDAVRGDRVKYSQLSGVAHSESIAVNAFIDLENSQTSPAREMAMHLPLDFAIEYAAYALLICARQHNAIAAYFSLSGTEDGLWQEIRNRAVARFRMVDQAHRRDPVT